MYVEKGGPLFGFCPGKATWDRSISSLFRMLMVATETGCMYDKGGLSDQPDWFVDLLAWFLPRYNERKFYARAKSILGDGESKPSTMPKTTPTRRK